MQEIDQSQPVPVRPVCGPESGVLLASLVATVLFVAGSYLSAGAATQPQVAAHRLASQVESGRVFSFRMLLQRYFSTDVPTSTASSQALSRLATQDPGLFVEDLSDLSGDRLGTMFFSDPSPMCRPAAYASIDGVLFEREQPILVQQRIRDVCRRMFRESKRR